MTDIEDVIETVVFGRRRPTPTRRRVERMDNGAFHLDYGDPDRVFVITVRQVARTPLAFGRPLYLGAIDDVRAELVKIAVANHVEIEVDAEQSPARHTAITVFNTRLEQWAKRDDHSTPPPAWPAQEFAALRIEVTDDVGTPYHFQSSEHGGHGTEFLARWRLQPAPPPTANRLTAKFTSPRGHSTRLDLSLDT